ncbi:S-adenosyl-L-methionine-dependent methyltransferase [Trichophaea hybrida]|nr:S-adenosyl-L-methionine-dependent methyltransferase [Trichophaea hybrida]
MADTGTGGYIEVDPALVDDAGSGYDSSGYGSYQSSTVSGGFSIDEYLFENGRRYHLYSGTDRNLHPTDETEKDRLDLHHEVFLTLLDGKLYKAPLVEEEQTRILDIGTGTGIWAVEIAEKYPKAEVIGSDLCLIQSQHWVPPNCRFEVDDAEQEWLYDKDSFSFIHMRNVSIVDWPTLMKQIYCHLKPGGYVEISDLEGAVHSDDGTMSKDNGALIYVELLSEALKKVGRPFPTAMDLRSHLEKAGFINVKHFSFKQPWGPWPRDKKLKQAGEIFLLQAETGFESYGLAPLTRILGMDHKKATKICRDGLDVCKNKRTHIYNYYNVAYGQKPEV